MNSEVVTDFVGRYFVGVQKLYSVTTYKLKCAVKDKKHDDFQNDFQPDYLSALFLRLLYIVMR